MTAGLGELYTCCPASRAHQPWLARRRRQLCMSPAPQQPAGCPVLTCAPAQHKNHGTWSDTRNWQCCLLSWSDAPCLHNTTQHNTTQHNTTQHNTTTQHSCSAQGSLPAKPRLTCYYRADYSKVSVADYGLLPDPGFLAAPCPTWLKKMRPKWSLSGNTSAWRGRLAPPESTRYRQGSLQASAISCSRRCFCREGGREKGQQTARHNTGAAGSLDQGRPALAAPSTKHGAASLQQPR
jgi:hypothetical protein